MTAVLRRRLKSWAPVLLIAVVAILLRIFAIDRLPPGLFGDEAVEGLDALDVMMGNFSIWFHAYLGREPMFVYLVALSYQAFGVTPLATRLPAVIAGILTVPAAFLFTREWALSLFSRERAIRIALLTTALLAISFWHIQMTRDAHRDTLLPLVEAIGYWLLWLGLRNKDWKLFAGAGAVLGLAVYTYSPGRFVGVFVALFIGIELLVQWCAGLARTSRPNSGESTPASEPPQLHSLDLGWRRIVLAGLVALAVMLPLGVYFAQNPVQFSRRFASVSIFDFPSPASAFASSVAGNLAQFVIPDAGYQSQHYNLPGKPIFDLLIAPWLMAGLVLVIAQLRKPANRFLLLWFVVMLVPAFLTADMIPKGVRVLGVAPGVFVFPGLAMDWALERGGRFSDLGPRFRRMAGVNGSNWISGLVIFCLVGSAVWTAFDYFVSWANLPGLPLAFDTDMVDVSDFLNHQPPGQPVFVSTQVYRHPTLMLLGKHVPTTQYFDRSTTVREFDARTTLVSASGSKADYVFVRDYAPPADWLTRLAPEAARVDQSRYFSVYRLGSLAAPQQSTAVTFKPLLNLIGYSQFGGEPAGIALYWQVSGLPEDRTDMQATLALLDAGGAPVTQDAQTFGFPPMEWGMGDAIVEWFAFDSLPANVTQFTIQEVRGTVTWKSPPLALR